MPSYILYMYAIPPPLPPSPPPSRQVCARCVRWACLSAASHTPLPETFSVGRTRTSAFPVGSSARGQGSGFRGYILHAPPPLIYSVPMHHTCTPSHLSFSLPSPPHSSHVPSPLWFSLPSPRHSSHLAAYLHLCGFLDLPSPRHSSHLAAYLHLCGFLDLPSPRSSLITPAHPHTCGFLSLHLLTHHTCTRTLTLGVLIVISPHLLTHHTCTPSHLGYCLPSPPHSSHLHTLTLGVLSPLTSSLITPAHPHTWGILSPLTSSLFPRSPHTLACNRYRTLDCGNHVCELDCHEGACPSCPLLPSHVTSCPCGATPLSSLLSEGSERSSCLDPVPTCGKVCGRRLPCWSDGTCVHVCTSCACTIIWLYHRSRYRITTNFCACENFAV